MALRSHVRSSTRKRTTDDGEYKTLEKALRKVLSDIANGKSRSNSQGWPEMAKTLRDMDEEKIKDTKEDIDTLLVFAGLFAAVLTPFLAETYQTLSQSSDDTSVVILQQISTQVANYVINNRTIHSTAPPFPADSPSFVTPPFALSVNILWFASLTLAMVTASFGILVKQWLREYMSVETSRSAKARLRVRHFRGTALEDWKVFDIAAALPLLLQLSLVYTVTPMVGGWATLFFFATVAPAISARCPYKTTLLKHSMQKLRGWIYSHQRTRWLYFGPMNTCEPPGPMEDGDAAIDPQYDVAILTTADAILLDDDLLGIMGDSLQDTKAKPSEIIDFVVAALHQRLPDLGPDSLKGPIQSINLCRLPQRAWTALVKITARTLKGSGVVLRRNGAADSLEDWAKNAITILSTFHPSTFLPEARDALTACMTAALIPTTQTGAIIQDPVSG
ncbi:hypothetical protein EW026_g1399 [Hermanssonia centrifuga]|uniref:DUF6535 domain-containing protein n=1 Tax=Hermanssonia centrifuga TaxID=98765 RepID=A0A4S4KRK8_9APHY|nr:hypothetical protein EW026_g1399 [Hermanssonia centrifuga]